MHKNFRARPIFPASAQRFRAQTLLIAPPCSSPYSTPRAYKRAKVYPLSEPTGGEASRRDNRAHARRRMRCGSQIRVHITRGGNGAAIWVGRARKTITGAPIITVMTALFVAACDTAERRAERGTRSDRHHTGRTFGRRGRRCLPLSDSERWCAIFEGAHDDGAQRLRRNGPRHGPGIAWEREPLRRYVCKESPEQQKR